MDIKNIRTMEITTSTGKDVKDTKMLSGEAKDSLYGTNTMKQYETGSGKPAGPFGGQNAGK